MEQQNQKNKEKNTAINLEAAIQKESYELANDIGKVKKENDLEKALGVLSQDGVYAFYVFCKSKEIWDKPIASRVEGLTKYIGKETNGLGDSKEANEYFNSLSENLYDLLFFKEIVEKLLIYTRYHLKAKGATGDKDG